MKKKPKDFDSWSKVNNMALNLAEELVALEKKMLFFRYDFRLFLEELSKIHKNWKKTILSD